MADPLLALAGGHLHIKTTENSSTCRGAKAARTRKFESRLPSSPSPLPPLTKLN